MFNEPLSGYSPSRLPNGSMNTEYTESGIWVFTTVQTLIYKQLLTLLPPTTRIVRPGHGRIYLEFAKD